jgi:hypothetical protein
MEAIVQSGVEGLWGALSAFFFLVKRSGVDNGVSIMGLSLCAESIGTRSKSTGSGADGAKKKVHGPARKERYLPRLSIGLMKPLLQMQLDRSLKGWGGWSGRQPAPLSVPCDAPTDCDNVPLPSNWMK